MYSEISMDGMSDSNSLQRYLNFNYDPEEENGGHGLAGIANEFDMGEYDDSMDIEEREEFEDQRETAEDTRVNTNGKSIDTNSFCDSRGKTTTNGSGVTSKGIRKKKYMPLTDEGRTYLYEDDPKKYMQVRKYVLLI